MKFLNLEGLTHLVNNIKNLVNTSAENTLTSSKKYTDEKIDKVDKNVELIKNQILDPDNYGTTSTENGGVVVVNFEQGSISSSTGEDKVEEGYLRTTFIPVENDKFTLYSDAPVDSTIRVFVYDVDKNWLSTANDAGYYRVNNGESADITSKAKYIRCRIGTTVTSGTLTVTFDDVITSDNAVHQKIYFNNGYNMESTLIEDDLYQLQVNAEENEFNIFTIAAPKNKASEATISLMVDDEEKTQFVDLSCMKYNEDENGTFSTILQSRGDTPLPSYVLGFNDGNGAGRVRKLEITPDAVPMQFISDGIRVRKDNSYDNDWTDDNSVVVNLAELSTKADDLKNQIASLGDTYYTEIEVDNLITGINTSIDNIVSGSTPVKKSEHATSADSATSSTNADTVDGYHADNFMYNCSNYGAAYFNSYNLNDWVHSGCYAIESSCTNAPSGRNGDIWGTILVIKGLDGRVTQIASFWNETDNPLWYRTLNGSNWTLWKRIRDNGNADTVDGYHAYEIQTKNNDGSLFTDKNNTAFIQWDGSNYFWLKAPQNATAVNHSETSIKTNGISKTGFGNGTFTYHQTSEEFDGNSGWCHYLIGNHGDGESYYHYTIGLPFYSVPIYQRQTGNADAKTGWHKFYTTENITYGTSELIAGTSGLSTGSIYLQYE